ncbi:gamma-glutamyl-gamma-aminobutyrate hydrolase family protein [Staphylospora marina]|uniref:gamma-glutamyl-gamma-aminobutyrate hydrolase family protein n=1 Tax=Staphylospora marina TaxID=2490858 RepID=UPI001F152B4B|nr:gamma-glutamyl-gamma-aminobutyrate hydrolase family protein [Staphylospora marina]
MRKGKQLRVTVSLPTVSNQGKTGVIVLVPLIGITVSLEDERKLTLSRDYSDSVLKAGGLPVMIPLCTDDEVIKRFSEQLDGLILSGGGDIDPTLFEEEPHPGLGEIVPERDEMEIALVRRFVDMNKPVFGICRGCQILNVALGGDMYQDLQAQRACVIQHSQRAPRSHASHSVQIHEGSLLHSILGKTSIKVNSFHHQAVRMVAPGMKISAKSSDEVVEAIESVSGSFVLGVQWHPECMTSSSEEAEKLFEEFVKACGKRKWRNEEQTGKEKS